jgi:galactonate dehydratase
LITEYFVNFEDLGAEITVEPFRVEDGHIALPQGPGLGVELRQEAMERYPYREFPLRQLPTHQDEAP